MTQNASIFCVRSRERVFEYVKNILRSLKIKRKFNLSNKVSQKRVICESFSSQTPYGAPERPFEWVASQGVGTERPLDCKLFRNTACQLICKNADPWKHHNTQDSLGHIASCPDGLQESVARQSSQADVRDTVAQDHPRPILRAGRH